MLKRRRRGEWGEVGVVNGDEVPVGELEECAHYVAPQRRVDVGPSCGRIEHDCRDHKQECGEQSSCSPGIETRQTDPPHCHAFLDQQAGDENLPPFQTHSLMSERWRASDDAEERATLGLVHRR